ncbi:MAG TPA: LamG-like jellyroll fold domain-containing protein, partial [Candidatus Dormibacteraeota bacterium]|nr:LamG-like jellyroll fold domain-containing protein [Candidatus Dormibacteraeota bacterium]
MGKLLKISLIPVILTLGVAGATAGTYYSTNVVGDGNGWFTGSMWRTNDGTGNPGAIGVNPQPSAGNIYIMVQGGRPAIGNNLGETRVRNIYTNNTLTTYFTFPGDSLELRTNTEIRFKQLPTPSTIENVNFPGVGGNPGLILNGGMLNVGDGIAQPVLGIMQAKAGSQSYLCPGGNDFQTLETARGLNILAKIVDSGTLCVVQDSTNTPVAILSTNNTYSGLWLVKAGRLRGGAPGSLGTNSSFVMDPNYTLPVPPFDASSSAAVAGPAVLEPAYDLNSAGTLVLTNGGKMRLHQNCAFTAVNIENSVLLAGTHYYAELITNFPNSFDTGGSGAITVQPYGNLPALGPLITTQPAQQLVYAGHTAHFSVAATDNGAPPLTYQWQRYTTNLVDGGNISGSTTATLTVNNVAAADATAYHVVVNNTVGPVTSADAQLTIVSPSGEAYEAAVLAANAAVFYQLNETGDPGTNGSPVFDFAGGFNGTYGTGVQNGNPNYNVAGPRPSDTMTGFSSGNTAARFANANINARVTVSPWNLNTNAVTLTAWVNPNGPQNLNEGIAVCRGGNTVAGLCYGSVLDSQSGSATFTYNWDNELETFSWDTGISPPAGQWSLIAAVITPTNATVHMMNANGIVSASRKYNHVLQGFSGTTTIGDDSSGSAGNRVFDGLIDDVAVFKYALSKTQLFTLFTTASGVSTYAPSIASQPTNASPYAGQTVVLSVPSGGSDPLTYQWQSGAAGSYTNVPEGGRISGTGSQTLTIANVNTGDSLDYILTIVNGAGSVTSSVANLNVQITSPAENITLNVQQAAGSDWDNATGTNAWSDNLAASVSSAQKPGSTYELLAPARLRTPTAPQNAVFPGLVLTVDGDSVWNVNPPTNATISEIRFKQPTFPNGNGSVFFKQLRMNGGQLDAGADSGGGINTIVVNGEIDILANTPINNDNGAD